MSRFLVFFRFLKLSDESNFQTGSTKFEENVGWLVPFILSFCLVSVEMDQTRHAFQQAAPLLDLFLPLNLAGSLL